MITFGYGGKKKYVQKHKHTICRKSNNLNIMQLYKVVAANMPVTM